jgi:1-acyl-sn-glycerol-3-phosphate acyltransferase
MKVDSQSIIEATGPISISKSIPGNKVWGRCIRFYFLFIYFILFHEWNIHNVW